jgi:NDP-sugar pyrophosphorylase family protein
LGFCADEPGLVDEFQEKPVGDGAWINGGFFVLERKAIDYIHEGDATVWEREPMEQLARERQLAAYKHAGFWRPMDTLRWLPRCCCCGGVSASRGYGCGTGCVGSMIFRRVMVL